MIQQTLIKTNEVSFHPHSMKLELLKNCPHVIPTLAQWLYEEWHPYDKGLSKTKLIESFKTRLNSDRIPIAFVVLKNENPVAVIALKNLSDPEFSDFPKDSVWLASFHVLPQERNKGIGQKLWDFVRTAASNFGHETLYFYTSNPLNVKWFLKRGASVIGERPFRQHIVTMMQIS